MNLSVKVKNKIPLVSVSSFKSLLIDDVDFSSIGTCDTVLEGYFGKAQIDNVVKAIKDSTSLNTTLYEDTLEVFFFNVESTINTLLDYLYLSNPVNIEDTTQVDIILENAVNKVSFDTPSLWSDKLIKKDLLGRLSSSFLDYEVTVNAKTKTGQCRILFRYLPDNTERVVILDLRLNPELIPNILTSDKCKITDLPPELVDHIKEHVNKSWNEKYNWPEDNYQDELYRSIMSNKGGITLDDFYCKSYSLMKFSNKLDSRNIEAQDGFSSIDPYKLNMYPVNIISRLASDTYNNTTINPGFEYGFQGWNRVSTSAGLTGPSVNLSNPVDLKIENTIINTIDNNPELILDGKYNGFTQYNRVPGGLYDLTISILTNTDRDFTLFLGDSKVEFTLPASTVPSLITLTDSTVGGIDLTGAEDGIVVYGFETKEISTNPELVETKIEYCRIVKK